MAETLTPIPNVDPFPNLQALLTQASTEPPAEAVTASQVMAVAPFPAGSIDDPNFLALQEMSRHLTVPAVREVVPVIANPTPEAPEHVPEDVFQPIMAPLAPLAVVMESSPEPESSPQPISADMLVPEPVFQGLATNADTDGEPSEQVPFLSPQALSQLGVTPQPAEELFPAQIIVPAEVDDTADTEYAIPLLAALPQENGNTETQETAADPEPVVLEPIPAVRSSRGWSMVFGGFGLLALALVLIIVLARQWSDAVWAMVPRQPEYAWLATKARFGTFAFGGASLTLAWLAVGAIRRNRWAVPLVHSLAWFVVISVMLTVAAYIAAYLLISPELKDTVAMQQRFGLIQWTLIVGMVLPLCFIFLFQRDHLKAVCRRFDRQARWTDQTPEPLLMLWWPCVLGCLFCAGVACAGGIFPWFGHILRGNEGLAASAGCAGLLALAAVLLAKKSRFGWVLALATFTTICASGVQTFLHVPFQQYFGEFGAPSLSTVNPKDLMPAVVFAAIFVALLAMLIMARGVLWGRTEPQRPQ